MLYRILTEKDDELLIELTQICERFHWDKLATSIVNQVSRLAKKDSLLFQKTTVFYRGTAKPNGIVEFLLYLLKNSTCTRF